MELKHLLSFATVVRLSSFSRAAEELYISQPTISLHIRQLEDELGTRLLLRTTKSIEVTEKGRDIYEYAISILSLRDRMVETCAASTRRVIHLGASTIPSAYILPEVLPSYVEKHPDTYFVIEQSDSQGVAQKLTDGLIDIGLIGMKPETDDLTATAFYKDHVVVITPVRERFLAMKESGQISLSELLKEPMILREEGSGSRKAAARFLTDAGVTEKDLHISARINDPEAIKNLVAEGLGISIISAKAAENYRRENRLLTFSFPGKGSTRSLYIAYKRHDSLPARTQEFIRYLKSYYRAE